MTDDGAPNMSEFKEHLDSVFTRIESATETLRYRFQKIEEVPSQFASDIEKINMAFQKFDTLLKKSKTETDDCIQKEQFDEDLLQKIRHDLRAQIGAVQGYAELIQEEMEDEADAFSKEDVQQFRDLAESSAEMLPLIADVRWNAYESKENQYDNLSEEGFEYGSRYENCKVLVIDDSSFNRDILERRLKRCGLQVLLAEDGEKGLGVAIAQDVDLILLDIMMPGINGYEVLGRLKGMPEKKDVPVLMISAINEVKSIVRCIDAGADDYLSTPFNPTILHARIRACLDKKLLQDEQKLKAEQLKEAQETVDAAIENIDEGFAIIDHEEKIAKYNENFAGFYPDLQGQNNMPLTDLLRKNYQNDLYILEKRREGEEALSREEHANDEDRYKLHAARWMHATKHLDQLTDGRWIEVTTNKIPSGLVTIHKDVTAQKKDEDQLKYMALHDALTSLPNRAAFEATLSEVQTAERSVHETFALLYLDLDGFKAVNDTLGHDAGDDLLKLVARKFVKNVRGNDFVARLGGDEFAILLRKIDDVDLVREIASRILEDVGDKFDYNDQTIPFGVSIGIAIYPPEGEEEEEFLKRADSAMYKAKKAGKGQYHIDEKVVA